MWLSASPRYWLQKLRQNLPLLCVNRIRYDFCAGAKAIRYSVNKAASASIQFLIFPVDSWEQELSDRSESLIYWSHIIEHMTPELYI